jgi:hypothetical protein
LEAYVTSDKLLANALTYPEMQHVFPEQDAAKLKRIRTVLDALPLVHSTHREAAELAQHGLLTHKNKPDDYLGQTGKLDQSLGLDEYSFLW